MGGTCDLLVQYNSDWRFPDPPAQVFSHLAVINKLPVWFYNIAVNSIVIKANTL